MTPKQHNASRRAKRKEASTLAQQTYNDNRAKRYHVQLVNANFGKGDFSWTGTYDDGHHPEPGDTAKADRDLTNYIKRLYRWCDKNGVQRPKWVAATEYCTVQEDGTACGRHHHHAIIQHTDGLTRDVLEQLWADKARQIGFTRCEYLDVDHGSVESLVRYVVPMEIDEHTVVRLSLRSMFNPELRYFFAYEEVYQEQKQEITAMLKRRNITKREVDSVYGIAEVGRQ